MRTPERIARIKGVLSLKQPDLHVVLEKVANPHNANAVLRTCDAAGVLHVDIIGSDSEETPINSAITTRADKWLQIRHHPTTEACLSGLRERGFQIAATDLGADTLPYTRLDMTKPTALVFGGEKEGLSPQALELADVKIKIPMFGMAQSLNLSVSAGIILYEALRQRLERGFFDRPRLSPEEFEAELDRWLDL